MTAAAALFGSLQAAQAKGPFRAEISGGDLDAPVTIEGPLPPELVFGNDSLSAPAVLSGDWDNGQRYFRATLEFQAMLDNATHGARADTQPDGDDGASAVWYIAPSLAAVGVMIAGGLAGRRLLFRHDE